MSSISDDYDPACQHWGTLETWNFSHNWFYKNSDKRNVLVLRYFGNKKHKEWLTKGQDTFKSTELQVECTWTHEPKLNQSKTHMPSTDGPGVLRHSSALSYQNRTSYCHPRNGCF